VLQRRAARTILRHRAALLSLLPAACGACGRGDPPVVLYASADPHVARQVIEAFERDTGVRVALVGDTEQQKTTGLAQRLRAEKDNPQADVFWSSEAFWTIRLADEGIFEPHRSPATEGWPSRYRDEKDRWYGFAARARVIVYAPDRVRADDLPRTWMELTHDRFRGRVVMADPRFGTTGGHLAAMKAYWDRSIMPGFYAAFLEGLAANEVWLHPGGNAGVVAAVAAAEADLGLTDTDDVWAAQAAGARVEMLFPRHDAQTGEGTGTLLVPNTVALVRGGRQRQQATLLLEFLLSEKVERMLAESVSRNLPLRPGLAGEYPQITVPDPLDVDLVQAARILPQAVEEAMAWLEQ
jgi:iron(III) transport system substrate-binding protein